MSCKVWPFFFILLFVNGVYAIDITRNIPYTYAGQQTLDLFMPDETGIPEDMLRPAAIVIHAGGWSNGDSTDIESMAAWFANEGFVVINVNYALAPENKWPAQFADVIQGVWWLKKNAVRYNINPDKILAVGASAGGHLAAMLGQSSVNNLNAGIDSEIHGVVSFSGAWNLLEAVTEDQIFYISQMLAVDTPEARYLASPVYLINRHSPPVLIFHGTEDTLVPFQQSIYACEVYATKGLDYCFLVPLEGHTHFSVVEPAIFVNAIRVFLNWWLAQ
ncbi:hypothetical protein AU255_19125 [Methyloprofundus sedimenti]|uniref:BD-FAE-like domain-containing protein n=1 Tax=Methyloprofundus sedimenti TaxID=1420851 RepID=A0A1V8M0K3_9GAMM|nr:alpha/beta hydrolase [Methyloprofundus sedimenti]OQK15094.1 hypothetical protein AU255_19125 [Methyloprofundus sedimenti]